MLAGMVWASFPPVHWMVPEITQAPVGGLPKVLFTLVVSKAPLATLIGQAAAFPRP